MLHRVGARRRSTAFIVGVAATVLSLPSAQAASLAYRCNNGGITPSHRCTELADAGTDATSPTAGALGGPISLSGDGRFTTFSTPDSGGIQQVQMRQLGTGATALVSQSTASIAGNGASSLPVASDDAARIAFISEASNLVTLDANQEASDVFVRNVLGNATTLLTPSTNPLTGADGDMTDLTISGDGSTVAIVSFATNLAAGDTNGVPDVFVVKTDGTGMRIGSSSASDVIGNDVSFKPALSDNGRFLAFASDATNLVAGDTNGVADVFVKDLTTGAVELVSVATGGAPANAHSGSSGVSISDDGRYVAFDTRATTLGAGASDQIVVVRDRTLGTTTVVPASAASAAIDAFPTIAGDGSIVSFLSADDLLLAGRTGGSTRVVSSVSATGVVSALPATSDAFPAGLSDDGTVTAFTSDAAITAADDNGSTTDLYVHIVDLRGPTVTAPAAGLVTSDTTPTLSATLQTPGNKLEVRDGGTLIATIPTSTPSGVVSTSLPMLSEGSHTLTLREVDGPYASDAVSRAITIDTIAPSGVAVIAPSDGAIIGNDQPLITGTAGIAAGDAATVAVSLSNGFANAAVPVAADGTWQVLPTALPSNGTYTIDVSQTDAAGNISTDSTSFTLNAGVPTIAITSPVSGATNQASATVTGTISDATSLTLTVLKDGVPIAGSPFAVTASGAAWSQLVTFSGDGGYSFSAAASNVAGSGSSNTVALLVDATAPALPTITAPSGAVSTTTPLATGTAEPGATMRLVLDGTAITPAPIANGTGAWSFQFATLSQGGHTLTARAEDGATNLSPLASRTFTIDTLAPLAPVISSPLSGSTLLHGSVSIIGNGEPGATVTVRDGAATLGSTTVAGNGGWTLAANLASGVHDVVASQRDAAMLISPDSAIVQFTVDPNSTLTTVTTPLDNSVLSSRQLEIAGTGKRNGAVQLSFVDGATETPFGTPVPVDANGTWSRSVQLNDGVYRIRARETTEGTVSSDRRFEIRSGVPIITAPAANAIVRAAFTVRGTALPGATVSVRDGGTTLGAVITKADGTWSLDVSRPDGTRTFRAHAGDGANRTPDSDPRVVVVDSNGPNVTIVADADLMGTVVGTPARVSGTATDAHRVTAITVTYRNVVTGQLIRSTTATCTGCGTATSVTFEDSPVLLPGAWTASVIGTDEVNNVGLTASARFVLLP